jgi:hypothetical protein
VGAFLGSPLVAYNVSTVGSVLSRDAVVGYVLTKKDVGYDWSPATGGGGTTTFDGTTIVSGTGGAYRVSAGISTAGSYLGSPTVAPNVSTVTSILESPSTSGYVLAKTGTNSFGWAAPAAGGGGGGSGNLTSITVNVVLSNTAAGASGWVNDNTNTAVYGAGGIVVNITETNAATNLPSGWTVVGTATSVGLANASLTAKQLTPVSMRVLYAVGATNIPTVSPPANGPGATASAITTGHSVGNQWVSYLIDSSGTGAITSAGATGTTTVSPFASLDGQTLSYKLLALTGGTPANSFMNPNLQIGGNLKAMYIMLNYMFDLSP